MIPNGGMDEGIFEEDELGFDFALEIEPSCTYAMRMPEDEAGEGCFVGKADDVAAMRQAIMKILSTERYEHEIYPLDYGIETQDLYGMDIPFVMSEVQERIRDAVTADDRFESVEGFAVSRVGKRAIHASFVVVTSDGEEIGAEYSLEVGENA